MTPEIHWIPEVTTGRLGIIARPRAGDWLSDEVAGWRRLGVSAIVCLLEQSEVRELGLEAEPRLCAESNIEFISFPIVDRGVPRSVPDTAHLVNRLAAMLRTGASVVIHCRAGIGRSGLIAACVQLRLGFDRGEVFRVIGAARGVSVPDTREQTEWLIMFSRKTEAAC